MLVRMSKRLTQSESGTQRVGFPVGFLSNSSSQDDIVNRRQKYETNTSVSLLVFQMQATLLPGLSLLCQPKALQS